MNNLEIRNIRYVVGKAVRYFPNAHLGAHTAREDIRSAFRIIRSNLSVGDTLQAAVGRLDIITIRHRNI